MNTDRLAGQLLLLAIVLLFAVGLAIQGTWLPLVVVVAVFLVRAAYWFARWLARTYEEGNR